jgi:hypothetical protein
VACGFDRAVLNLLVDGVVNDVVFRSYAAVLCLERDAEASRRGATHFESGVLAVESDESGLIVGLMGVDSLTDERGGEVRSGGF